MQQFVISNLWAFAFSHIDEYVVFCDGVQRKTLKVKRTKPKHTPGLNSDLPFAKCIYVYSENMHRKHHMKTQNKTILSNNNPVHGKIKMPVYVHQYQMNEQQPAQSTKHIAPRLYVYTVQMVFMH